MRFYIPRHQNRAGLFWSKRCLRTASCSPCESSRLERTPLGPQDRRALEVSYPAYHRSLAVSSSFQQPSLLCSTSPEVTPSHLCSIQLMTTMHARLGTCNKHIGSAALSLRQTSGRLRQHPSQQCHIVMSIVSHEMLSSSHSLTGAPWTWQPESRLSFESSRGRLLNAWIACTCTLMRRQRPFQSRKFLELFSYQ